MDWTITYGYDQVGNRTSRIKDGTTVTYTYDDNDKLTAASGGGQSANFFYNEPHPGGPVGGNITKVTGSMLGTWTLSYNDENRPTSISYPGGTDTFLYNALGQRMRVVLNGTARRYFYHGERVLEETNDTNGTQVRYTSAGSSYYEPLVHFKRADGSIRLPLIDGVGTVRRLVDQNAGVTDLYSLDAFGRYLGGGANPTPNPYRFGGAWGYITDTPGSGLLQLGARYYWPELGRFIQQDPIGDGMNWYAYADNNPVVWIDPTGEKSWLDRANDWMAAHDPFAWIGGKIVDAIGAVYAPPGEARSRKYEGIEDIAAQAGYCEGFDADAAFKGTVIAPAVAAGMAGLGREFPDLPDIGPLKLSKAKRVKGGKYEIPGGWEVTIGREHGCAHLDINPIKGAKGRGKGRYRVWPVAGGGYRLEGPRPR